MASSDAMALPYLFAPFPDDPPSHANALVRQSTHPERLAHAVHRASVPSVDHGDREYVERIRAGDDEAYGALFTELYPSLREFAATYVASLAVAEELVQDVFLDLWVRRASWDPQHGVRAYLFRAVRNRAINAARDAKTAARLGAADMDAWAAPPPPPPDAAAPDAALIAALAPMLAQLPPARRRAALLRWRFGLSYAEIASALGTSVASVTMHIARAREAVRPVVERYLAE